ncbi:hypothetical protein ACA910_004790 [Epithemia clementina (nom. ined.)]
MMISMPQEDCIFAHNFVCERIVAIVVYDRVNALDTFGQQIAQQRIPRHQAANMPMTGKSKSLLGFGIFVDQKRVERVRVVHVSTIWELTVNQRMRFDHGCGKRMDSGGQYLLALEDTTCIVVGSIIGLTVNCTRRS